MAKGDLWVAVQPASIGLSEDDYLMVNVGDVAMDGHPVLAGREHMFDRLPVRFKLGDGKAESAVVGEPIAPQESSSDELGADRRSAQRAQEPSKPATQAEGKAEGGKAESGSGGSGVGLTSGDAPGARRTK